MNKVTVHEVVRLICELDVLAERLLPVVPSLDEVAVPMVLHLLFPVLFQIFELGARSQGLHPLLDLLAPLRVNKLLSF